MAMLGEETGDNIDWRVLTRGEEDPNVAASLVHDEEIGGIAIIRENHPVGRFVPFAVRWGGGAHEPKVHVEAASPVASTYGRALSGVFSNACLCFKVDEAKWVMVKFGWDAGHVTREAVELSDTRGAEAKKPKFRFQLLAFGRWGVS